ncbi:MAG: efflux RND transporter permease subunit, partial [Rhodobacteraceae bacterium]|nr:efflux RND transporter permease subunit [Paracoccaceae bacterium]
MHFSEIFIRRPVLSTVLAALITFLGLASVANLPVRQYPEVEESVITITTVYPGAAPDLIQGFVTSPIAAAVSTTENMDYITSQSRPSASVVTVQMKLGADPDIALTEVMSKVQQVRGQLPQDTEDPVIAKGTGRTFALMYLAARNPNMTPEQLNEYLARVIRPRVTNIDGVAQMEILGGQTYAMRIWLDPLKLSARGVTASEVLAAIRSSNFLSAPGKTENEYFSYSLTLDSTIQTPEAFGALPVVQGKTGVVRLRDVARIELASGSSDAIVTFAGEPGTFIGIIPAPGENQLDVATNVRDALPALTGTLPRGMTIDLVYDSTETIAASIQEVFKTIAEAVLIVVVVILLFLGSFRSVLMPIVTIPLSLIGVCSVMLALGYSINLLTLLAMVLAIGLVVDDAIVVVENIHRHIDEGMSPARAAIRGMKEIAGPVIAMTITLAAVLSPLAFTGGLTGSLFTEFALTLAGSVVISGLVALTITPAMSARLLSHDAPGRFQRVVDRTLGGLANWYERRVSSSLDYRPVTMLMVVALLGVSGFMFLNTSSELAPEEDNGALFAIMNGPRYATLEYTDAFTQEVSRRTADIEEVQTAFSVAGMGGAANSGFYIWALKDWADRSRSQSMIQQQIQGILDGTPGL